MLLLSSLLLLSQGIWMWARPFIRTVPSTGDQVAVFIVDTQASGTPCTPRTCDPTTTSNPYHPTNPACIGPVAPPLLLHDSLPCLFPYP